VTQLAFLAVALAAPVPKEFANPRDYFPTAVGSKWEYVNSGVGQDRTHAEEITAAVEKDGVTTVTFRRTRPEVKDGFDTVYAVGKRDIALAQSGPLTYDPPLPYLKKGMKVGDAWEVETEINRRKTTYELKVGEAAEVKTPAGTFVAVPVTRKQKASKLAGYTYWYAPDVGLVRIDSGPVTTLLTKYTPGK
jgi:hypothetical protein